MHIRHITSYLFLIVIALSPLAWSQSVETGTHELLDINTQPAVVSAGQDFALVFTGYNLLMPFEGSYTVEGNRISVTSEARNCYAAGNPPHPRNDRPFVANLPITGLPAGTYQVEGDWGEDCFGQYAFIEREITIYPNSQTVIYNHESPANGDVVSGVNVIRGWACYPEEKGQVGAVTYTIDDHNFHFPLPYGSIRQDTVDVCGLRYGQPAKTGYGGVVYWPITSGGGDHTLTIHIDGKAVESVSFTVVTPPPTPVPEDVGYRKGAAGDYIIDEFLGTQESVLIRWSEADQNFIIVEYN
jgi:hypothetical protein